MATRLYRPIDGVYMRETAITDVYNGGRKEMITETRDMILAREIADTRPTHQCVNDGLYLVYTRGLYAILNPRNGASLQE